MEDEPADQLIPEGKTCNVHTVGCLAEAQVIEDALKAEGIPVMVETFESRVLHSILIPTHGWGQVLVLTKDRDRAETIITDLLEGLEQQAEQADEADDSY